jgi:hypothetical protein
MEPTLYFIYNTGTSDSPCPDFAHGAPLGDWRIMSTISGTNIITDKMIFTGGGILGTLPVPTCASGTRDASIKPDLAAYIIPQTYIETATLMYNVPMAGIGNVMASSFRYVFGVYVEGRADSDVYLEAWDDATFSTTSCEVLKGTPNSGTYSLISAIRTTNNDPPWHGSPGDPSAAWTGNDSEAVFLRGDQDRLGLNNLSYVEDKAVYYNIYIKLETDCTTFHNTPVLGFRYLYT